MPTRNVVLTQHQETFIGELVRSGRYSNASEVLRESLQCVRGLNRYRGRRRLAPARAVS